MVRVEKQGKDLRRDDVALKQLIDKKSSKKEVEKIAARVKYALESVDELCKRMDDAHLGDDKMDEGEGGDGVQVRINLKCPLLLLCPNHLISTDPCRGSGPAQGPRRKRQGSGDQDPAARGEEEADTSSEIIMDEKRDRRSQGRSLLAKIEAVDDKVMVDRRALKKTEADIAKVAGKVGRVERKLEAEVERVVEELHTLDREQTSMLNLVRDPQQQVNQLRQTVGAGMVYN